MFLSSLYLGAYCAFAAIAEKRSAAIRIYFFILLMFVITFIVLRYYFFCSSPPGPFCSRCVKKPKSHTNPFKNAPWCVNRPESHTNLSNTKRSTLDRAAPSSMERLSLRDGYFARRLFGSINWCRAPATPKPGPLLNRPLATSRPVSIGPKERKSPRHQRGPPPFGYFKRGKRPSPYPPAAFLTSASLASFS